MNFLEKPSFKSFKTSPNIRLVVNSFTGNEKESEHSEEIKRILKLKNYRIAELIDINQELIFEKDKKISKNIREEFHKKQQLNKINSKFSLPQIKIGDDKFLSYDEFIILNESGLFDKIMKGSICTHIRIFNNEIVYSNTTNHEFSYCIYCYSKKKTKHVITLISNLSDNKDEENNDILSYVEATNLTIKLIDYENYFKEDSDGETKCSLLSELVEKREKVFFVNNENFEIFQIYQFFEIFEKRILRTILNLSCLVCGKKVDAYMDINRCVSCLVERENDPEIFSKRHVDKKIIFPMNRKANKSNKPNNPYNFINKLKLKQINQISNIDDETMKTNSAKFSNLNISFRK